MLDRERLCCAAGFFNGEGNVLVRDNRWNPLIQIGQVDRDVLDVFCATVGVGYVGGPYASQAGEMGGRKQKLGLHKFWAEGFEHVQAIMAMLWPWLSPAKRTQFRRAMAGEMSEKQLRFRAVDKATRKRNIVEGKLARARFEAAKIPALERRLSEMYLTG